MSSAVLFIIFPAVLVLIQGQQFYTGPSYFGPGYTGPIHTDPYIYTGPYNPYYRPYRPYGYPPLRPYVNTSLRHIADSFYYRIVRRLTRIPISQKQAKDILDEVDRLFSESEQTYFQFFNMHRYKQCLVVHTQITMEKIQYLQIGYPPYDYNIPYNVPDFFMATGHPQIINETDGSVTTEKSKD